MLSADQLLQIQSRHPHMDVELRGSPGGNFHPADEVNARAGGGAEVLVVKER